MISNEHLVYEWIDIVHQGIRCPYYSVFCQLSEELREKISWEVFLSQAQSLYGGNVWNSSLGGMDPIHMVETWATLGVYVVLFHRADAFVSSNGFYIATAFKQIKEGMVCALVMEGSDRSDSSYNPIASRKHMPAIDLFKILEKLAGSQGQFELKVPMQMVKFGLPDLEHLKSLASWKGYRKATESDPSLLEVWKKSKKRGARGKKKAPSC